MKRIVTIILTFTLIFSSLAVSSFAASSSGGKYVRVKKATYQKYKKAYTNQKKLKLTIKQQKNTIKQLEASNAELEQQSGINDWLWMSINSLGLSYENKTWTVPAEFPSTFMINGTKYTVRRE